jgi:hypothetical protein
MSLNCFAIDALGGKLMFGAQVFSFFNIVLFITSLISIRQFFWPGDEIRLPFHIFNLGFVILFYSIGLPFLVTNSQYYEGYAGLTPLSVVGKFFLTIDLSSFAQWLIVASLFVNILYIRKYRKSYFESGVTEDKYYDSLQQNEEVTTADVEDVLVQE